LETNPEMVAEVIAVSDGGGNDELHSFQNAGVKDCNDSTVLSYVGGAVCLGGHLCDPRSATITIMWE